MVRSSRRITAYKRKSRADRMTPARARESAAAPNDEPVGMFTRTGRPGAPVQAATLKTADRIQARALLVRAPKLIRSRSTRARERMLQEDRCCQRINFSFPIARRAPHFANCSKRGSSSEPFIDQLNRQPRTAL